VIGHEWDLLDIETNQDPVMKVFDQYLNAWGQVDQNTYSYGKIGIDDFVFELVEDGDAVSIEPRVLGLKLMRI
jgi:hypothetical protein